MGLLTGLLGFPVSGPVRAIGLVVREAEDAFYDPAVIRRQLDEVARLHDDGWLDDAEAAWWEEELVARLMSGGGRGAP